MKKFLVFLMLAGLSWPVVSEESPIEELPGYVDFDTLAEEYGEPRVMININGFLLKFMAAASSHDPAASALMSKLQGVRVNVYDTAGVLTPALEQIANVKAALQKEGWQPAVQVKEEGEEVQIFMKVNDTGMQGLTVMTVNEEEAVFINILGEIDPAQLNVVMDQLSVDVDVDGEG